MRAPHDWKAHYAVSFSSIRQGETDCPLDGDRAFLIKKLSLSVTKNMAMKATRYTSIHLLTLKTPLTLTQDALCELPFLI